MKRTHIWLACCSFRLSWCERGFKSMGFLAVFKTLCGIIIQAVYNCSERFVGMHLWRCIMVYCHHRCFRGTNASMANSLPAKFQVPASILLHK
ncbi:hypothetical protein JB92DRAFT_2921760 [Gautieria morchelliformis]|nr:hypothetical protein JB92DRAFT_2921760 [Gautieria morchelliformis]